VPHSLGSGVCQLAFGDEGLDGETNSGWDGAFPLES